MQLKTNLYAWHCADNCKSSRGLVLWSRFFRSNRLQLSLQPHLSEPCFWSKRPPWNIDFFHHSYKQLLVEWLLYESLRFPCFIACKIRKGHHYPEIVHWVPSIFNVVISVILIKYGTFCAFTCVYFTGVVATQEKSIKRIR